MVHASLRRLGPIEGRADGVIDGLMAALSPDGTLLMPLGAAADVAFDAWSTPADPDIGVLAEIFRQRTGVEVSDHPAGRWGAWGNKRLQLLKPVPHDDYHGPGSTLERFVECGGWVLRLGADPDTTTLTHLAEYLAEVPDKIRVRRAYRRSGDEKVWVESLDDCNGFVDEGRDETDDYFSQVLFDYLETGRVNRSRVGRCEAELFRADEFVSFAVRWLERQFAALPRR
jgi:aminoglycoside N3'-acetyltransferase